MIRQVEIHKTNVIIRKESLISLEQDTKEFEIEGYTGTTETQINTPALKATVPAAKKDDFTFIGANDVIFKNLPIGSYYYFRARIITSRGEAGQWSEFTSELIGDNVAGMTFITTGYPKVIMDSSAVIFRVAIDQVPADFKEFQWYFLRAAANLTDTTPPTQPAYPGKDVIPNLNPTTFTQEGSSIISEVRFSGDKLNWYHVWARAVDKSGNSAPDKTVNNGWLYVGCGKVLAFNAQTDQDNLPPDGTKTVKMTGVTISGVEWIGEEV
ncbi:MAG TPA: PQQ-binding-like beta-propeller repeat protein [Ignavibacteriales bacterium]|nr:PQQ-binding-like beta-propeller repeat protein [Ignavibacteriales bacterium]